MADSNRQIETLEAELRRLREVVFRLGTALQQEAHPPLPANTSAQEPPTPSFYWLGKLAVTLTVAAFVTGFFFLVHRAAPFPIHAGGGLLAVLLLGWGLYAAAPGRLVSQGALACGLGAAFISGLDVLGASPSPLMSAGMLFCIAVAAAAVWWKQSEATFSVVAVLACVCAMPDIGFNGAGGLGMALVLCLCVFLVSGPRAGMFPVWAACAAVFAQLAPPLLLTVPSASPVRSLAALLLIQSLTSLACLRHVVRGGTRVYNAALLVLVNSILCTAAVSSVLESARGNTHALGMAVTALLFALLAGVSHGWRPAANLIMAALSTAAMVAASMGVWSGLPEELFAPALAAGSAVLVVVYRQTGSLLLRRLEAVSAMAAFGFCLFRLQLGGLVTVGTLTLPANWLNAFGTMFFLSIAATLHEKCFPGGPCKGAHNTQAMTRAALAGLILLTITVLSRGADTALPFVLAAESLGMIGLGMVLLTPQIGVAGMFLLAPAHLCWHAFIWQPLPGFTAQPDFAANTVGLIAFTLAGAAVWEHYLRRFHRSTAEWDHYAVVALPFLAAAFLSCTLLRDGLPISLLPAGMAALGVLCLAPSRMLRLDGLILAALFCLGSGSVVFGLDVYPFLAGTLQPDDLFVPGAAGMIVFIVAAERLAARLYPGTVAAPNRPADTVHLLLCVVAAAATGTALYAAAQGPTLGWGLTGASLLFVYLGWSCETAIYSSLGTLMLLSVPVSAFAGMRGMAPGLETAAALGIAGVLAAGRLRVALRGRYRNDGDDHA